MSLRFSKFLLPLLLSLALSQGAGRAHAQTRMQPEAQALLQLANRERAGVGAGALAWDEQLALAARQHCLRMAEAGPISHKYYDEADLTDRTSTAGAHFSLIEENVAMADSPERIHTLWMNSQGHRENLLNPRVNRVGIAVVYSRGRLYAVADYARGVEVLGDREVESRIAELLSPYGLSLRSDNIAARQYCGNDEHLSNWHGGGKAPGFLMRWTASELSSLPEQLTRRIATGRYRAAEIGSCGTHAPGDSFTAYHLAVLLY